MTSSKPVHYVLNCNSSDGGKRGHFNCIIKIIKRKFSTFHEVIKMYPAARRVKGRVQREKHQKDCKI